ncbi:MAG: ATP-binding protein [Lachnospiraceae bacterium]|nr:ATP-binding protein [Lachnospiraceae bacterium]
MGIYLNPGNEGFKAIRKGIYVDKTGLIDYINGTIGDASCRMTCFSRPRRFGKSYAAKMLCAYYDKSCDSHELFEDLEIAGKPSYEEHLNQYDVIYLDITYSIICAKSKGKNILQDMQESVIEELRAAYPGCVKEGEKYFANALVGVSGKTGGKFIVIIDEWDALFREAKDDAALQREYVELLRGLFKGGPATDLTIAAAYMTGILPIKKYGTQSAMTDFIEFTMANPDELAQYVGFTQDEVKRLCEDNQMDFEEMRVWYDGYSTANMQHIYNPNSVMKALQRKSVRNYWTMSETFEDLKKYIGMNFDGLKDAIIAMLGGQRQRVDADYFQNDLTSLTSRDNVLTLLIHLGYLAYDSKRGEAYIPNAEVSDAFKLAVRDIGWDAIGAALADSDLLLENTIGGDCEAVSRALDAIHESSTSVLQYNNEISLSCAITIAYYTARRFYEIIRELPTGKGFADLAFVPRKNVDKPALVVELKYNKDADSAIKQIHEKRYEGALKGCAGNMLLVGINYDKETKKHSCVIEKA